MCFKLKVVEKEIKLTSTLYTPTLAQDFGYNHWVFRCISKKCKLCKIQRSRLYVIFITHAATDDYISISFFTKVDWDFSNINLSSNNI